MLRTTSARLALPFAGESDHDRSSSNPVAVLRVKLTPAQPREAARRRLPGDRA
jgi:hypothetical protein